MRWNLASKFSATILGVVALAILSSLMTFYGAWRVNIRLEQAGQEVFRVRAEEAEIALAEGSKWIAVSLVDRTSPSWEKDYRAWQLRFQNWLKTLQELDRDRAESARYAGRRTCNLAGTTFDRTAIGWKVGWS